MSPLLKGMGEKKKGEKNGPGKHEHEEEGGQERDIRWDQQHWLPPLLSPVCPKYLDPCLPPRGLTFSGKGAIPHTVLSPEPPRPLQSQTLTTQIIVRQQAQGELNQKSVSINKPSQCAHQVQALEGIFYSCFNYFLLFNK